MAANPEVRETIPTVNGPSNFDAAVELMLAGATERIQADLSRARELGIIDERGNRLSDELPPDMRPRAVSEEEADWLC